MKFKTVTWILSAAACSIMPFTFAQEIVSDVSASNQMNCYINGYLLQACAARYTTRPVTNGSNKGKLSILTNTMFKNYDAKNGAIVTQGNRFWLLGGEGTVNNKRWQSVDTVITGIVDANGKVKDMKEVRKLPYASRGCKAYLHNNRIYFLGGHNRRDFVVADIKENGELGEWKQLPAYPNVIYNGGLTFYKGCFYANGQSTWKSGSDKMYALKLKADGMTAKKWERVESPEKAQGHLIVHKDALYYLDELSGNIYKTTQDEDGVQLNEWTVAGKTPFAPETRQTAITKVPGGWLIMGGFLPLKNKKFAGFFKGVFLPESALK